MLNTRRGRTNYLELTDVPGLLPGIEYMSAALAFAVEAFLFLWHLHGRDQLNVYLHLLLVYAAVLCFIAVILEMYFRRDHRLSLLRSGAILLQGTWLIVTAIILYPVEDSPAFSGWDPTDHVNLMLIPLFFTWNIGGVVLFQWIAGSLVFCCVKRRMERLGFSYGKNEESSSFRNGAKGKNGLMDKDLSIHLLDEEDEE